MRRIGWKILASHLGIFALGLTLGYFAPSLNRNHRLSEETGAIQAQIKQDPKNADNWSSLGVIRSQTSDKSGAIAAYEKALELDSSNVTAQVGMGNLRYEDGDFDAAAKWYADALRAAQQHNNPSEIFTAQQLLKFAQARKVDGSNKERPK
jgi:cytochrome c-type biogenesis protein CcmH/NrfG